MKPTMVKRFSKREGMALLLVVMVLSSMLILGTAFMHNMRLDHDAAVNYARTGQAEIFALDGLHRAMAEIMYDIWGVSEDFAFACSPEWGQMMGSTDAARRVVVDTNHMKSAYAVDGSTNGQIVGHNAAFRRSIVGNPTATDGTQWVQTGLRWMWQNRMGLPTDPGVINIDDTDQGIHYGGHFIDEFLPEHTDNADLFQLGLHSNHGYATGRDYATDENEGSQGGSWWSGTYWPDQNSGEKAPWDYVDTRISPDSIFHVFRYDLVDPNDWRVHCTGVLQQAAPANPLQPIAKEHAEFKATHLGVANPGTWPVGDVWGGAVNINQVNNDYRWEIFFNYKSYAGGSVPTFYQDPQTGLGHHYKEAKWVYIYDAAGNRKLGRYAVTVEPDLGRPNANTLYDGPNWGGLYTTSIDTSKNSPKYLQAIDKAFLPHGDSNYNAPVNSANPGDPSAPYADIIKACQNKYSYANCSTWADNTCSRINQHIRDYGMISNRSELAMLLRKDAFNDGLTDAEFSRDARIITSLLTTAGYEYLLGPHWYKDRIIIDCSRPNTMYGATAMGSSVDTRNLVASYLQELKYYWGPDQRVPHAVSAPYSWWMEQVYHYTPFHEPKADNFNLYGDFSGVPDPTPPAGINCNSAMLQERGLKAKLSVISWLKSAQGCFHDWFNVRDLDDQYNLHAAWSGGNYLYVGTLPECTSSSAYADIGVRQSFEDGFAIAQLPVMHKIVQAGRVKPYHPTSAENGNFKDNGFPCATNGTAPGFDEPEMDTTYYFVSLAQSGGYSSSKMRVAMPEYRYMRAKLYVGGTDVIDSPGLLGDPTSPRNSAFMLYATPDMDGDGMADIGYGDNSGGNDQSLRVDVWAWDGADGGVFARSPCWLAAYEDSNDNSPAVAEVNYTLRAGDYPWLASTDMDTCRGSSGGGSAQRDISSKKAHTLDSPVCYITVFWKSTAGIDGDSIFYVGSGNVMDVAKLPGNIGGLADGEAYSSIDLFNNHSPESWQKTPVTYPWRNYLNNWYDPVEGYDSWASSWCGKHWTGGLNPNNIYNMWPSYRRGKQDDCRMKGWHAAGHAAHSLIGGNWCIFFDSWPDLRRCPLGIMPAISGGLDNLPVAYFQGEPVEFIESSSSVGINALGSYQVYNPYYHCPLPAPDGNGSGVVGLQNRAMVLHYGYDPDLRIWMDMAEVSPLNQYFMTGQLTEGGNEPPSAVPAIGKIFAFPVFDAYDNNLDGIVDLPTDQEFVSNQVPGGFYMSDRKCTTRVNLNLINHPACVWYLGVGGAYTLEKHQLSVVGRKPLYGYTSLYQFITRCSYGEGSWGSTISPYNKRVWWGNLYASPVNTYAASGLAQEHIDPAVGWAGNISFIQSSPVFTVYLTAQTLKEDETDPDLVEATSEIKIQATVERTYDGKMNIVEFNWIPQDVAASQ